MSIDSVESVDYSVDIVHDTMDNVQADWTISTESMGSLDIVHGQSPLFFLTELVNKTSAGEAFLKIYFLP